MQVSSNTVLRDKDDVTCVIITAPIDKLCLYGCANLKTVLGTDYVSTELVVLGSPELTIALHPRNGRFDRLCGKVHYLH